MKTKLINLSILIAVMGMNYILIKLSLMGINMIGFGDRPASAPMVLLILANFMLVIFSTIIMWRVLRSRE